MKLKKGDLVWWVDWGGTTQPQGVLSGVIVRDEDWQFCYILPLGEVEPLYIEWEWICGQEEEALELFREYSLG